jgi:hypothetical protein
MAAKHERVRVDLCNYAATACANVCEDAMGFSVRAKRLEVEVIDRRALRLVECWAGPSNVLNVGGRGLGIPLSSEPSSWFQAMFSVIILRVMSSHVPVVGTTVPMTQQFAYYRPNDHKMENVI